MKREDITDAMVCTAAFRSHRERLNESAYKLLCAETGAPGKIVYAAMLRTFNRGLIEFGVSLPTAWISQKGIDFLLSEPLPPRPQPQTSRNT